MSCPQSNTSSHNKKSRRTFNAGCAVVVRVPIEIYTDEGHTTLQAGVEGKISEVGGTWYIVDFDNLVLHVTAEEAEGSFARAA